MKAVLALLTLFSTLAFAGEIDLTSLVGHYDVNCPDYSRVGISAYQRDHGIEIFLESAEAKRISVPFERGTGVTVQQTVEKLAVCRTQVMDMCFGYDDYKLFYNFNEKGWVSTYSKCGLFGCGNFVARKSIARLHNGDLEVKELGSKNEVIASCVLTKKL